MVEVNSTIMGSAIKRIEREEDVVNHPNHYAPNGVDSFMHMKDQMGVPLGCMLVKLFQISGIT